MIDVPCYIPSISGVFPYPLGLASTTGAVRINAEAIRDGRHVTPAVGAIRNPKDAAKRLLMCPRTIILMHYLAMSEHYPRRQTIMIMVFMP